MLLDTSNHKIAQYYILHFLWQCVGKTSKFAPMSVVYSIFFENFNSQIEIIRVPSPLFLTISYHVRFWDQKLHRSYQIPQIDNQGKNIFKTCKCKNGAIIQFLKTILPYSIQLWIGQKCKSSKPTSNIFMYLTGQHSTLQ